MNAEPALSTTTTTDADAPAAGNGTEAPPTPVGERLRAHRKEAGLSLRGLAREVGVSPA